jgi:hypothetical protein
MEENRVSLWRALKSAFTRPVPSEPADAPRLDGASVAGLSRSLGNLPRGERGWITFDEARNLFSAMDAQYAFGELDQEGNSKIAAFAADNQYEISFMPVENRVYFWRKDL